ncbi:MAG: SAV_6107 family HEPN domain-containing protein [Candidatus Nanopelagicales bacterium]
MTAVPTSPPVPYQARELLGSAARGLLEAYTTPEPNRRYATAHLAALRAAAAVLATRAQPVKRGRIRSVWSLLPVVAPQLEEWSAFFAANATRRAAADAGLPVVSQREADDLLRDAEAFLQQVAAMIGVDRQDVLPGVQ